VALRQDDLTPQAVYGINHATDRESFLAALKDFHAPQMNIFYADVEGHIGMVSPGLVPIRAAGDGTWCASDNLCTHAAARLTDGWLEGCTIECPLHAGRFDLRTGAGQGAPIEDDLLVYPVRVEGDDVLVQLPAD